MNEDAQIKNFMEDCALCPRNCHANRLVGERGCCGETAEIRAARAALHMWEEPCISGESGSGTIFFTGCPLGCVYCQNKTISGGTVGKTISTDRLMEIFFELKSQGAHNINLVTAGHFMPQVCAALRCAALEIPIVYNTSGYEKPETLRMADGLVDVYLPDFKYMDPRLAKRYSHAPDYPEVAKAALAEMVRQAGEPVFDEEGMMKKGVIVRHLVLPGHADDSKAVVRYLYETYGDGIYISIMNQYTPMPGMGRYQELTRRLTKEEYDSVVDYAVDLGIENGFIQEGGTAEESFIPPFDITGI